MKDQNRSNDKVIASCIKLVLREMKSLKDFYFVHSYYVPHDKDSLGRGVAGVARYGKDVAAVIARPNLFATQFHPEKSQEAGLSLLRNFLQWDGQA